MDYYGCENARQLMMLEPWRMNKTESPPRQRRRLRVGGLCTLRNRDGMPLPQIDTVMFVLGQR